MYLLTHPIRAFLKIVEAGSITGAARVMGVSKSRVSESLQQLEASLGSKLMVRTTRRQSLTKMGQRFYRQCKTLSDLSNLALEEISEQLTEPMGPLRITVPHAFFATKIAPAMAKLVQHYPKVRPQIIIGDERLDLIEHQIDLALSAGELPSSDYISTRLETFSEVLYVSPKLLEKYNLKRDKLNNPAVIQDWPYIANHWEGSPIRHQLKCKKTGQTHSFQFKKVIEVNTVHGVLALLQQGAGIACLPQVFVAEALARGTLLEAASGYEPKRTPLYAIHVFGQRPPLAVRMLIDAMKPTPA